MQEFERLTQCKYQADGAFFLRIVLRITFLWLTFAESAWAYVDPGSGMLIWQGLIAGVGAVLIFVRNPIRAIRNLIDWIKGK
ncbi:hypothetical protein [Propionivibrio dicarboxylicus]|uniref:hypothetical protein n=1 Tax=Propionivibrio dicarboxylicus TaxID=83767 RepID=UPI00115F8722|nr:hypothetical protein [Propionivibrio dicarboxylicus]